MYKSWQKPIRHECNLQPRVFPALCHNRQPRPRTNRRKKDRTAERPPQDTEHERPPQDPQNERPPQATQNERQNNKPMQNRTSKPGNGRTKDWMNHHIREIPKANEQHSALPSPRKHNRKDDRTADANGRKSLVIIVFPPFSTFAVCLCFVSDRNPHFSFPFSHAIKHPRP